MSTLQCHCGDAFESVVVEGKSVLRCANCKTTFISHEELKNLLETTQRCFTPRQVETLRAVCRERKATLVSGAIMEPDSEFNEGDEKRIYFDCPACKKRMDRRAFSRVSGIVVQACSLDGVLGPQNWLADAVQFIAEGGELLVLEDQLDEARAEKNRLQTATRNESEASTVMIPILIPYG